MERMQDGRRGALARAAALDPSTDPEQAELVLAEAQCAMAEIQDMRVTHEALRKLSVDES